MSYVDESSKINRDWLLSAARVHAKPGHTGGNNYRLAPARLAFANVVEPRRRDPKPPATEPTYQYETNLIFPWELTEGECFGAELQAKADELALATLGNNWRTHPKTFKYFKDQATSVDKKGARYRGFNATGFYVSASSKDKVPLLKVDGTPIADADADKLFRSGNWVLPIVGPFLLKGEQNGVSVGLNALIFLAEDEELGGGGVDVGAAVEGLGSLAPPPISLSSTPFD
jgi:hypothetical protein